MMTWERTIEERTSAACERMRYLRTSAFAKALADRLAVLQGERSGRSYAIPRGDMRWEQTRGRDERPL